MAPGPVTVKVRRRPTQRQGAGARDHGGAAGGVLAGRHVAAERKRAAHARQLDGAAGHDQGRDRLGEAVQIELAIVDGNRRRAIDLVVAQQLGDVGGGIGGSAVAHGQPADDGRGPAGHVELQGAGVDGGHAGVGVAGCAGELHRAGAVLGQAEVVAVVGDGLIDDQRGCAVGADRGIASQGDGTVPEVVAQGVFQGAVIFESRAVEGQGLGGHGDVALELQRSAAGHHGAAFAIPRRNHLGGRSLGAGQG